MKVLFLLPYVYFTSCLIFEVAKLIWARRITAAVIGLFWTFVIVPDFVILNAYGIPGTFLLVFAFICVLPFVHIVVCKKTRLKKIDIVMMILLMLVLGFGLVTKYVLGISTEFYGKKLFNFIYSLLIPLTVIVFYNDDIIKSYDLWKPILLYAILAYAFKNFSLVGITDFRIIYERDYLELKNVIFAARILGIGCLMCAYDLIREFRVSKLIYLCILLLQVLLFESRGVILALACATAVLWWFRINHRSRVIRFKTKQLPYYVFAAAALVLGVKYLWDSGTLNRLVREIQLIIAGGRSETRMYLYPLSIQAIKDNFPFGVGFGNTKLAITKLNSYFINDYPHNIILELFLEEGPFLALPFMILFVRWFNTIFTKDRYSSHTLLFSSLFIFAFINSMFSGDVPGNNGVFFFGCLAYWSKQCAGVSGNTKVKVGELCV